MAIKIFDSPGTFSLNGKLERMKLSEFPTLQLVGINKSINIGSRLNSPN